MPARPATSAAPWHEAQAGSLVGSARPSVLSPSRLRKLSAIRAAPERGKWKACGQLPWIQPSTPFSFADLNLYYFPVISHNLKCNGFSEFSEFRITEPDPGIRTGNTEPKKSIIQRDHTKGRNTCWTKGKHPETTRQSKEVKKQTNKQNSIIGHSFWSKVYGYYLYIPTSCPVDREELM